MTTDKIPVFPPTKHTILPVMGILVGAKCQHCGAEKIATVVDREAFCLVCKKPYVES